MPNPHAQKFIRNAEKLVKKYDKPSNSGTYGMRPKRSDWKKKVTRPLVDFGRRAKSAFGRATKKYSKRKQYITPGLRGENRKFAEKFVRGKD
jgi:hypothetical protein